MAEEKSWVRTGKLLAAGGVAGAVARTCVSPLDRVKLIYQVQDLHRKPGTPPKYTSLWGTFRTIFKEEGFLSFWRGNGVNVIRIVPYSAAQFMAYEQYKAMLLQEGQLDLNVPQRLLAGACAGMTSTALTHPLDTLRLRLAINTELKGMVHASRVMYAENGVKSFFKGIGPTLVGIAPYVGLNFASYDTIKRYFYPADGPEKPGIGSTLLIGAVAGTFAQTVCYPLDTIRRRQQMGTNTYKNGFDALRTILAKEGMRGFFKGYIPNSLKVVPNNAIRFVTYEFMKKLLNVHKRKTDT